MTFSIAGKTAIVTGAANGVGLAIARHFVDQGANVMFADMDEKRLIDEVGRAEELEDGNSRYFAGDLREKLTIANLLSATIDAYDRVDILVNASRQVVLSDPLNPDDDAMQTMLNQNLLTSFRLGQVVAKRMIRQAEEAVQQSGQMTVSRQRRLARPCCQPPPVRDKAPKRLCLRGRLGRQAAGKEAADAVGEHITGRSRLGVAALQRGV